MADLTPVSELQAQESERKPHWHVLMTYAGRIPRVTPGERTRVEAEKLCRQWVSFARQQLGARLVGTMRGGSFTLLPSSKCAGQFRSIELVSCQGANCGPNPSEPSSHVPSHLAPS